MRGPAPKRAEKSDGQSLSPAACAKQMSDLLPEDPLAAHIGSLRDEQLALASKKRALAKELRNAQRKKARLRSRARQLTDSDLVAVMMMRKEQRAKQENRKEASAELASDAASSGGASSSGSAAGVASSGQAARVAPEDQDVAETDL